MIRNIIYKLQIYLGRITIETFNRCSRDKWNIAQEWELEQWESQSRDNDDWNLWWKTKFFNYSFIKNSSFDHLLEVGCGPYAKNTKYILQTVKCRKVSLLDPLLDDYIKLNKSVIDLKKSHNAETISKPLEQLSNIQDVDLLVCINVLDHGYDLNLCLESILNTIKADGLIILGQELTTNEDLKRCTELIDDIGHPIKVNHVALDPFLKHFEPIIYRLLDREEGRNPNAHSSTLLFCGRKIN